MARILVVEDDLESRLLVGIILQRAGYETREAEDGAQALDMLEQDPLIDLVVSDVLMPAMDGLQFLEEARGLYPSLPVVMFSAHLRPEWVEQAMRMGASCYLLKPFTREQLVTIVGDILSFRSQTEDHLDYVILPAFA